jgi:hypothetical protein
VLHTIFGLKEDPNYKFSLKKIDVGNVVIILIFAKRNGFQYEIIVASNLHHRTQKP